MKFELSEFQQKALSQNNQKPCEIVAGIRPNYISVGEGDLKAKIVVNEMMGAEVHLHADCDGDEVVMVIPTVDLKVDVSQGAEIRFNTKPELIQLFDKDSGNNLIWFDEVSSKADAPVSKTYNF